MHAISNKSKKLDIMTNGNKGRFPVFRCDVFKEYYAKMKFFWKRRKIASASHVCYLE